MGACRGRGCKHPEAAMKITDIKTAEVRGHGHSCYVREGTSGGLGTLAAAADSHVVGGTEDEAVVTGHAQNTPSEQNWERVDAIGVARVGVPAPSQSNHRVVRACARIPWRFRSDVGGG